MKSILTHFRPVLAMLVIGTSPLLAQEPTLDDLRQTYETEVQKIRDEHDLNLAALLDSYGRSLDRASELLRRKGDPDPVLATNAEKMRFTRTRMVPKPPAPNLPPEIRKCQQGYHSAVSATVVERNRKFAILTKQYAAVLDRLMRQYTVEDKLDMALNVKSEKKRVEGLTPETLECVVPAMAKPIVAKTDKPGPLSPPAVPEPPPPEAKVPPKVSPPGQIAPTRPGPSRPRTPPSRASAPRSVPERNVDPPQHPMPKPPKKTVGAKAKSKVGREEKLFRHDQLERYCQLEIDEAAWDGNPRTNLANHAVGGKQVLTKASSPYLIVGTLLVPPGAKLVIEPGAILLFDRNARIRCEGTLEARGNGDWIVFAPHKDSRWSSVWCSGRMNADHCLFVGASSGVYSYWSDGIARKPGIEISTCIFYRNERGATTMGRRDRISNSLFVKNKCGLMAGWNHARLPTVADRCLFIANGTALDNKSGQFVLTRNTFYSNGGGLAVSKGRVHQCNVFLNRKPLLRGGGNGKIDARESFWGEEVAEKLESGATDYFTGDVSFHNWSRLPFVNSMPSIPYCQYLIWSGK